MPTIISSRKLREERTGEFEHEITRPPNPDDWFRTRIIISEDKVEVYVNEMQTATLIIDRLSSTESYKIGIWTGHNSSGRFRNMILYTK